MITLSIESNNLHVKQIECIQVNCVAQVPPHAIWLRCLLKKVYSILNGTYKDNISGSDAEKKLTIVASSMEGLHQRLIY